MKSPKTSGRLTPKQHSMVVERLKDPKAPNATIIKRAGYQIGGEGNRATNTASQIYLENMRNPEIVSRLEPVIDEVEQVLINNVRKLKTSKTRWKRELANENSKWIHDKVRGKSKQITEVTTTGITLSIDLTSTLGQVEADNP